MQSAPPAIVSGLTVAGIDLQSWVYIVTIFYVLLQSFYLAWKFRRELRD